ncbi:MAG: hypothetical protein JW751_26770 [Polyangiaceae bacterium]|nr:hypothetical protein [Polyangiaceae bacterium]
MSCSHGTGSGSGGASVDGLDAATVTIGIGAGVEGAGERQPTVTRRAAAAGASLHSRDDMEAAVEAEHPELYFVGGVVDLDDKRVALYRGDLDWLLVPLDGFESSGRSPRK